MSFCVAGVWTRDILTCLKKCRKPFVCDRRNTFARFSEDDWRFSWQTQRFGCVHLHFVWQVQHFRRVVLRVFGKPHCQGCLKWWQHANCVAGVGHRGGVILRGRRSVWLRRFVCGMFFFAWQAQYSGHSTFYTLHFVLYTWHSTLRTLHFTLHSLHFTLHTPHSTLETPHCALYFTIYTLRCALYFHTLHLTPYTLHSHFTFDTPHSTLHFAFVTRSALYTLHTLHSTIYTVHFTLPTSHFTLDTLHFTLHTPHSRLYTLHFALDTWHSTPLHTL